MQIKENFYTVNNVKLHVVEAGDISAPAILFLHGFPDFWYGWRKQMDFFVSKGYRVIVPDQRGYHTSSKPAGTHNYRLSELVADVVQLLELLNVKQVHLAAHDWGGIVAWSLIKQHPQLFLKIVIFNAPYLPAYRRTTLNQLRRSWYVFFFQIPSLPEWILKRNHFSRLSSTLLKTSLPGTFSKKDIEQYKESWKQKGSLTGMLNWYRALVRYSTDAGKIFGQKTPIQVPVLVLWGAKDTFLRIETGVCPPNHCTHFRMKTYEDATHWLHLEKSDEVNKEMLLFFTD